MKRITDRTSGNVKRAVEDAAESFQMALCLKKQVSM